MRTQEPTTMIAYWLIPNQNQKAFFESTILELAHRFDAPVFEPHVTVYVTRNGKQKPSEVLDRAWADCKPIELFIRDLQHSDLFTKTLFVRFDASSALTQFNRALSDASALQDAYDFNPHLSLLYKDMPRAARTALSASIHLPFSSVVFDLAKAVICPAQTTSRKDVENWQVAAVQSLTT